LKKNGFPINNFGNDGLKKDFLLRSYLLTAKKAGSGAKLRDPPSFTNLFPDLIFLVIPKSTPVHLSYKKHLATDKHG
jgi:hypothetical protein